MSKKTPFDYISEFVGALNEISNDEKVTEYLHALEILNRPLSEEEFPVDDIEKLKKHRKTTKKKYVKIFHGLYEEQSQPIIEENYDWILQGVVIPSTRPDIYIDLTQIYMSCDQDSKLNIFKYLYLICICLEGEPEVKETLKEIFENFDVEKIKHHETMTSVDAEDDEDMGNPLANMFNHMTQNMPQPEDPSKPDIGQMFGFVTHMMGDPKMQKNIEALTQQANTPDGLNNIFSNMQETFTSAMARGQNSAGAASSSNAVASATESQHQAPPPKAKTKKVKKTTVKKD